MSERLFRMDDLYRFTDMTCGEYSATTKMLAFVRAGWDEAGRRVSGIVVQDVASGTERAVTVGGKHESEPRFSPDGKTLALVSDGQLWLYDLEKSETKKLTSMQNCVSGIQWSPRGDQLLFSSHSAAGADERELQRPTEQGRLQGVDDAVAITDFGYKFDGAGFVTLTQSHLWIVDATTRNVRRLTDGAWDDLLPAWTPNGETVVFVSGRARPKQEVIGADLFAVPSAGGEIRRISTLGSVVRYPIPFRPLVTPDGKYVIAAYLPEDAKDPRHEKGLLPSRLMRVAVSGDEEADIFDDTGACYECTAFPYNVSGAQCYDRAQLSSDGKRVFFFCGSEGRTGIYQAEVYGQPCVAAFSVDSGSYAGIGRPKGGLMLASYGDEKRPCEYYLLDERTGQRVKQLTNTNGCLRERTLSAPRELWFATLDGESSVQGWVLPPQGMSPGVKYPAVLYIHGGPHPYYTPCFDYELQCIAAAGFAVLYCNPRGTSGYGKTHLNALRAMDGSAYTDLLQFVEEAIRRFDFIDGARVGATGGSYGGYMVNYMATHSKRFKCFVTQRSIANELISYASSDMQGSSVEYVSFLDFMKAQLGKSAVCYAKDVSAPILIMHGMEDLRCPVEGAHQFFVALKDTHRDVPVRMILWPHTGHNQPARAEQLMKYREELVNWFRAYL